MVLVCVTGILVMTSRFEADNITFFMFLTLGSPKLARESGSDVANWLGSLSDAEVRALFTSFRDEGAVACPPDSPKHLGLLHTIHCDALEYLFFGQDRGAGSKFEEGLVAIEFLHFLTVACKEIFEGHPPPPRPIKLVAMLLSTIASVTPAFELLIKLQVAKDCRQGAVPPAGCVSPAIARTPSYSLRRQDARSMTRCGPFFFCLADPLLSVAV